MTTNIIYHNGYKTYVTADTTIQDFTDIWPVNADPARYHRWLKQQQGLIQQDPPQPTPAVAVTSENLQAVLDAVTITTNSSNLDRMLILDHPDYSNDRALYNKYYTQVTGNPPPNVQDLPKLVAKKSSWVTKMLRKVGICAR